MTFGPHFADCSRCEFNLRCNGPNQLHSLGRAPKRWVPGGLMFVLEAPSIRELATKQPQSPDVDFLRNVARSVGVDFDQVWVTYAMLTCPVGEGTGKKGGFHVTYPSVVPACLPRLEAEIKAAQPRVIMTFGNAALAAVAGEAYTVTKRARFDCPACDPEDRKIGPVFKCALGDCDWHVWPKGPAEAADPEWRKSVIESYEGKCPKCESSITKVKAKRIKCFKCKGLKMREEEQDHFKLDYALIGRDGIAGAILHPAEHQSRLDDYGVRYIIPTYTAWFCRKPIIARSEYTSGGQFIARALAEHMRKAHSLLTRDAAYDVGVLSTEGMTPEQAAATIRAYCAEPGTYAVDIEANTYDGVWADGYGITCVGFARYDLADSLVVDTRACGTDFNDGHPIVEALAEVLGREDVEKVFVNRLYDEAAMRKVWGIEILGPVQDAMVAHIDCYPDEEHGLGFMAHELTDAPAWKGGSHKVPKGERDPLSGYHSFESLALYNARDTYSTLEVDIVLRGRDGQRGGRLDEEGVRQVYESDMRQQKLALEMQMVGMPVGLAQLDALRATGEEHTAHHLKAMRELVANPEFEPRGQQLLDTLFDPNGFVRLPVTKEGKSGKPSADQSVLLKHVEHPFVQHLLAWRKHDYALSHYIDSPAMKPSSIDGRWHPVWKPHGARTGRWTSEPNFQNWPKYIRKACVAGPGRKLVGYDYDQLELRGIGWVSGDERLIRMILEADGSDKLNPDCDLHSYNAANTFGEVFTLLDRNDPQHYKAEAGEAPCKCQKCQRAALREVAKTVIYAVNYGSGAETVHENIYNKGYEGPPITVPMVKATMTTIFTEFPGLVQYRADTLERARETGEIRSPLLHRHRIFPLNDIDVTVAYNYPIQSLGADIVNRQIWPLYLDLTANHPDSYIIAQVHDAVYVECPEDKAERIARLVEHHMNTELPMQGSDIIIPFTGAADIGQAWSDV